MQPGRAARGGAHGPYGKRRGSGRNGPFRPAVLYTDASRKHASLQKQSGEVRQLVLNHCPDRLHTILPGALLMDTVTKSLCREELYISRTGVREGYLYHKVLRRAE